MTLLNFISSVQNHTQSLKMRTDFIFDTTFGALDELPPRNILCVWLICGTCAVCCSISKLSILTMGWVMNFSPPVRNWVWYHISNFGPPKYKHKVCYQHGVLSLWLEHFKNDKFAEIFKFKSYLIHFDHIYMIIYIYDFWSFLPI